MTVSWQHTSGETHHGGYREGAQAYEILEGDHSWTMVAGQISSQQEGEARARAGACAVGCRRLALLPRVRRCICWISSGLIKYSWRLRYDSCFCFFRRHLWLPSQASACLLQPRCVAPPPPPRLWRTLTPHVRGLFRAMSAGVSLSSNGWRTHWLTHEEQGPSGWRAARVTSTASGPAEQRHSPAGRRRSRE